MASEAQTQTQQPVSAEEEAVKRNTDCVYFLASPLTCKKGSECEYRHSDIARLNPRDCWYWTNGNCLNPKCGFRHPPLEGFVSAQAPTSTGPSVPQTQTQTATTTTTYAGNNPGKQGVPCVFFQRGYCLKGDWCPFLHVPSSSSNKTLPVPAYESATLKKAVEGIENSAQEKKAQTLPVAKSVDVHVAKTTAAVQTANLKNEFTVERRAQQASAANEFPGYRNTPPIFNGNQVNWPNRVQNPHTLDVPESLNSKDEDEVSREPSPGFDVLVDDEGRDSDYYPGEDRHGMPIGHEMNEYDIGPSSDYFDCDDERYQDPLGYDSHEGRQVQYSWEQRRASSERMLSGGSYLERRPYGRNDGHVQVDESDLRHRLSRHKKPNGLRSVVSRDMHFRDRSRQGSHEERTTRDNALNSRLRGRIKLPGKPSSPTNGNIRRSPVRISVSPRKGRIQERIKGRVEDSYNNGWRNRRSPLRRDDVRDGNNVDFAGPKSLAELKNKKIAEPTGWSVDDEKPLGKRKHSLIDNQQQSGVSNNFEGPKSLEEILKRKKGETSGTKSVNKNSSDNERRVEGKTRKEVNDRTDKEVNNYASSHKKDDGDSKRDASNMIEAAEGGEHVDDGADLEVEAYEQKDGDYEYEQTGGEDYEYYDGENVDAVDEEYVEDGEEDEDDEFAKKLGVMYS